MNELLELQKEIEELRHAKWQLTGRLGYLAGYLGVKEPYNYPLSVKAQNKLSVEIDEFLAELKIDRY